MPHAAPGTSCNDADQLHCGYLEQVEYTGEFSVPQPHRWYSFLNVNLAHGPSPGDFPPRSAAVLKSSCPLIPADAAQVDSAGQISYVLQDANFNVTALVWGPTLPTTGPPVQVQYTYTPYGELLYVEDLWPGQSEHLQNRAGFQGLFFERLDGAVGAPPLAVGGRGLYHVRNRWYEPRLGRFTSRDPNESAQPLLTALASNGDSLAVLLEGFDLQGLYGDGANLFAAFGSNPLTRSDALGLEWGWDEEIDDAIADRTGHAFYALGVLNEGARIASVGLQTSLRIAGALLPGSGLYDAFQAVRVLASGRGGFWEALDLAMVAFPAAKLARDGFSALRGAAKARGYLARACRIRCFVVGTPVDTPAGPRSIECLNAGDEILTRDEYNPADPVQVSRVTRAFRVIAPAVIWLTLSTGEQIGTTPAHEFFKIGEGWTYGDALVAGDTLAGESGTPIIVETVILDSTPTMVHSIEVGDTATFFVSGAWVHNNACSVGIAVVGRLVNHHTIPRQIIKMLPKRVQDQMKGLRGSRKVVWQVDETEHKLLHGALGDGYRWSGGPAGYGGGAWNARWRAEMHARGNDFGSISLDELLAVRNRIAFGLRYCAKVVEVPSVR